MAINKATTMKDIAKYVGVSRTAVSYVLNNHAREKGVSPQLERRIRKAAEDLNYRPSIMAWSVAHRKSILIGVILPHVSSPSGSMFLRDIEIQAQENGYQTLLAQHEGDTDRLTKAIDRFLGLGVEGIILLPSFSMQHMPIHHELREKSFPLICIDRDLGDDQTHFVGSDLERGVTISVKHLAKLGHRRIALYNSSHDLPDTQRRKFVYHRVLEELGLPFDSQLHREDNTDDRSTAPQDVAALLELPEPPTAIIAASSSRAIAAYQAITERGLRIPEDISLVAMTGLPFTGFHRARITSARFSYESTGAIAFGMLLDMIADNATPPQRILLPPQLDIGDTAAPLRPIPRARHKPQPPHITRNDHA